ncbi:MAG: hypothetical protein WC668_03300 [Patescibacteria group bacterium]|jgi:hypothetical protein
MVTQQVNELGTINELKQLNPWLGSFQLSDSEIYAVMDLIGQVIWGDIDLNEFWLALQKAVIQSNGTKRRLALEIAKNRFRDFQDDLGDIDAFIEGLQSKDFLTADNDTSREIENDSAVSVIPAPVESVNSRSDMLSRYDWSTISGLERRLLLEELGVSRQELDEYLKSQQLAGN